MKLKDTSYTPMDKLMNSTPRISWLKKIGTTFFGSIKWNSPPWVQYIRRTSNHKPKIFWSIISLCIMAFGTTGYAIYWYKNLPEPIYITASITPPAITPNKEKLIPYPLIIDFGINARDEYKPQSVAPISQIGKTITTGIDLTPNIEGTWQWENDHQLKFTPKTDWPAGQEFTIQTDGGFFAPNTLLKSHTFNFSTQPFAAHIEKLSLYQDPVDAQIRKVVATIQFNYPVNEQSLKQYTSLNFLTLKEGAVTIDDKSTPFSYTLDANKRTAYLHSANIDIKKVARYLQLTLGKNTAAISGAELNADIKQNVLIPDNSNFLKIINASASIIRNSKDKPEQILTLETSLGVNEAEFNKALQIYLLPKDYPATRNQEAIRNYNWHNPGEVNDAILSQATKLPKEALPLEHNYSTLHHFKLTSDTPRYLYIKIKKGMNGLGGFSLSTDYVAIIPVPEYPKEISFLHQGSLLALSGEKKLSVLIRGVPAVQFNFARVLPDNINQLITQTQGDFNNPYFINPSFNQQNISELFSELQIFNSQDLTQQQYTALDLEKYINKAQAKESIGPHGLFLLQATGWDVKNKTPLDVKASRLILMTDLALLVKDNNDGSHEVFVSSISQGTPVAGVLVTVLGKNGLPIISQTTNEQGQASLPNLKDFSEEREPVVYLARFDNDVSFIPYNNYNRQLNFSKFDIGGVYTNAQDAQQLTAYIFSDRGIYKPGDTVHIGMIVRQAYAQPQPAGLPLYIAVQDPRGTTIKEERIALDSLGFATMDFSTNPNAPTGQYTVNLYLLKDDDSQQYLGSETLRVAEFQPDRMKISATFLPKPIDGWSSPNGLTAKVSLWNLYGAPATDRRVSAKIILTPESIHFPEYPDYTFLDPLNRDKKPAKTVTETLPDLKTNEQGDLEFPLNLSQYEKATYRLTFFAEGFEAEGGRSVAAQTKTLISPLPYFVGYKADGDLSFIKQNSSRLVNYVAINPQMSKEELNQLKIQLISLRPVSTLIKKADGTYQYQSVMQSAVISSKPFTISSTGANYQIPTATIGDYMLQVLDKEDTTLSQLKFSIVGASQTPLAKNAELAIKLNKQEYKPSDTIELQITAPYTGSGLITIERDKVYAAQWFISETTNSTQSISIPPDFQGNGYVNVSFIRAWDSPELFVSPLSYSVTPFTVNHDDHEVHISLDAAAVARPGQALTINYHTDKPGKMIVFAVDEGILQVSQYTTPDPLAYFFQKHALEVLTQQTVDQILPKFVPDRELSAVGGDDGSKDMANHLNPFKRKTDLPVVYWSGIVDADTTDRELVYQVPDYFNGKLRIMAVAVSADSLGAKEIATEIRGDFILNPNIPTFVAPGDEFIISSSVANNLKDSGEHALITVTASTSSHLELIGPRHQEIEIGEGQERAVQFKVRAQATLGASKITLKAQLGKASATLDSTLSVRPASPLMTTVSGGQSKEANNDLILLNTLYPEYRKVELTMATNPLIFIFGLQRYLDNYPYGCTEQITSKALPLLAINSQSWLNQDQDKVKEQLDNFIQMLSQRQLSSGGFSYWPGLSDNEDNAFISVYVMNFLTLAREQGIDVPRDLFFSGISYLKDLAGQTPTSVDKARIQAYAIYLLTRNELVTTNYLANLETYLQQKTPDAWQKEITGVYIAASYQLLQSSVEANRLIGQYQTNKQNYSGDFYTPESSNAQYLYIVAKHFPNLLPQVGEELLTELIDAMNNQMNTLVAGYTSMALSAYQPNEQADASSLFVKTVLANKQNETIASDNNYLHLLVNDKIQQLELHNPERLTYFYQLSQAGFTKQLAQKPLSMGLEVYREYRDRDGTVINSTQLGNEIEVHIKIRALDDKHLSNIAIEDLLPGGFEVVRDSVKNQSMDFFDVREDRVNFFGDIDSSVTEIIYTIKATNPGVYTVPPIYAQAMYNPKIQAHGVSSLMDVLPR